MIALFLRWLATLPPQIRLIVGGVILVAVLVVFFVVLNQAQSCGYSKASREYDAQSKAWQEERTKLIARAEEKEKRVAELEPKAMAFDALAEQNKKVDAGLAQQIEEVSKNAAAEESRAEVPVDCRVRAARVCELLRANGIKHDCERVTKESCGPGQ